MIHNRSQYLAGQVWATQVQSPAYQNYHEPDNQEACTALAQQALLDKTLYPHYFEDGIRKSITSPSQISALVKGRGFRAVMVDGQTYLTRGLPGGAPKKFSSTQALAEELKKTDLKNPDYARMQQLAVDMIDLFAQNQTKTKPLIEEVTALAFANNTTVTKHLIKVLVKEINQGELLDVNLLKALKTTVVNSLIDGLDPDDLINVLQIIFRRITQIHQEDKTNYKLYIGLSTISDILDVMGDANVIKLNRINLHDPLYNILNTLSDDNNTLIAAQAAYAKQSLARVPNDESKFRSVLRRGMALGQGIASLCKVVTDKDLSSLLDTYDYFKQAIELHEGKKQWYGDVRILKLISEKRDYKLFTKVIDKRLNDTSNPHIVGNILFILQDVAHDDPDLNARKWAIEGIADLFLNDSKWGNNETIKKSILAQLMDCAALPDQNTANYTKAVLGRISDLQNLTKLQRKLINVAIEKLPLVTSKALHHVDTPSTTLITGVKQTNVVSIQQKIEEMKERALNNEDVLKDLASYIPVLGSRNLFSPQESTFDLDQAITTFLNGDHKVFLLLGDSGGGKSTYLRFLENRLWKEWSSDKPIPLFVSLPALNQPAEEGIQETLKQKGFAEEEIADLKNTKFFIFLLDGYDELNQKQNIFDRYQLHKWKARTIITCRSEYLIGEQSNYYNFFTPPRENYTSPPFLDEAAISPFTKQQIKDYCNKFIQLHKIPKTWEQYKTDIESFPGLMNTIENPFILRMIVEVLPSLIKEYNESKSMEKHHLRRIDIFDAFIRNWFDKGERKILRNETANDIPNPKKAFAEFAQQLASEMVEAGTTTVEYEEKSGISGKSDSKWDLYFGSDPKIALVRSGVPIRKAGPYKYAFMHKSLLEYFVCRSIISSSSFLHNHIYTTSLNEKSPESSQSSVSFDQLNRQLLTKEPEIIDLLAECVAKYPLVEKQLFEIIEKSKTDPHSAKAAANAITILNAAGVSLSQRDFSGIRISGANLSGANLSGTDFSYSVLDNVDFSDTNLSYASMANSSAGGVDFGQMPYIDLGPDTSSIFLSSNGCWALVAKKISSEYNYTLVDLTSGNERKVNYETAFQPRAATISHDGKYALTVGSPAVISWGKGIEKKVISLNLKRYPSDDLLNLFLQDGDVVTGVAISRNGKRALSGGRGDNVYLWDCQSGKLQHCFKVRHSVWQTPNGGIIGLCVTFSPDSNRALCGGDGCLSLWDCQTGTKLISFQEDEENNESNYVRVTSLDFCPDGNHVLSAHDHRSIKKWDCQTGKEVLTFERSSTGQIHSLAISPDGKYLLAGVDKDVILWDCQTGKRLRTFYGHTDNVVSVAFSPNGNYAYSGSDDGKIRMWKLDRIAMPILNRLRDYWLVFSGNQHGLFYTNLDEVSILNLETGKEIGRFGAQSETIYGGAIFPDGKKFLAVSNVRLSGISSNNDTVSVRDCLTGENLRSVDICNSSPVSLSHDDKKALLVDIEGNVCVWELETGKMLQRFDRRVGSTPVRSGFSPDDKLALVGYDDGGIDQWDCQTGEKRICSKGHSQHINFFRFSPDCKRYIYSNDHKVIYLLDSETSKELCCLKGQERICDAAFLPDRNWIITGSYEGSLSVWDCITGKQLHRIPMGYPLIKLDLIEGGKRMVLSLKEKGVQLWELFDHTGRFKPSTIGRSMDNPTLFAEELDLHGVRDLSTSNKRLLLQHGAKKHNCSIM